MRIVYHRNAEAELIEAAEFYDRHSAGLGADYLDCIDQTIKAIRADPYRFEAIKHDLRRASVRRFPYTLIFRIADDAIRILAVKHHSRDSDYWTDRR